MSKNYVEDIAQIIKNIEFHKYMIDFYEKAIKEITKKFENSSVNEEFINNKSYMKKEGYIEERLDVIEENLVRVMSYLSLDQPGNE